MPESLWNAGRQFSILSDDIETYSKAHHRDQKRYGFRAVVALLLAAPATVAVREIRDKWSELRRERARRFTLQVYSSPDRKNQEIASFS